MSATGLSRAAYDKYSSAVQPTLLGLSSPTTSVGTMSNPFTDHASMLFEAYNPEIELLWTAVTYGFHIFQSFVYANPKVAKARGMPHVTTVVHTLALLTLLARYHYLHIATRAWPTPDGLDAFLMIIFLITSLALAANKMRRSKGTVSRTSFQAVTFQIALLVPPAYTQRSAALHHICIKCIAQFMYVRWVWAALPALGITERRYGRSRTALDVASIVSADLAAWESGYPGGIPVFYALFLGLWVFKRWAARRIAARAPDARSVLDILVPLGFIDYSLLNELREKKDDESKETRT